MGGSHISFASDYERDVSPIVKMGVSYSLNPSPFVYDCLGPEIIYTINDFDSKSICMGSHDEGASSKYSSFDVIFSDDDVEGDQMTASKPLSSHVASFDFPALLVSKM